MVDWTIIVTVLSIIIPIAIMFGARAMDRGVQKGDNLNDTVDSLVIKVERLEERLSNHIEMSKS